MAREVAPSTSHTHRLSTSGPIKDSRRVANGIDIAIGDPEPTKYMRIAHDWVEAWPISQRKTELRRSARTMKPLTIALSPSIGKSDGSRVTKGCCATCTQRVSETRPPRDHMHQRPRTCTWILKRARDLEDQADEKTAPNSKRFKCHGTASIMDAVHFPHLDATLAYRRTPFVFPFLSSFLLHPGPRLEPNGLVVSGYHIET